MWRITHVPISSPAPPPGDQAQRSASGSEASTSAVSPGEQGQPRPSGAPAPLPAGAAKQGKRKPPAAAQQGKGKGKAAKPNLKLVIESPEWGPHAERGDGGVWAPFGIRPRSRSAYVCRKSSCVSFALSRKARFLRREIPCAPPLSHLPPSSRGVVPRPASFSAADDALPRAPPPLPRRSGGAG